MPVIDEEVGGLKDSIGPEAQQRRFQGIWIPAGVWLDDDLTALDKIILMEITSLDNARGCTASNRYIAEFCKCSERKVTESIGKLRKKGFVAVESARGRKRILRSMLANNASVTGSMLANNASKTGNLADSATKPSRFCYQTSQNLLPINIESNIENNSLSSESDSCEHTSEHACRKSRVPTKDEVTAYCREIGASFDVDYFFDYWQSVNWMRGKSQIKDWKSVVRNWERREHKGGDRNAKLDKRMLDAFAAGL